jgi:nucleotide-binding universal stress UspA family protein
LVKGLPTTRILEVAESKNAIMIVMGSKGRGGIKRLLLGSVAERVVQLSPLPVTVAKINKN